MAAHHKPRRTITIEGQPEEIGSKLFLERMLSDTGVMTNALRNSTADEKQQLMRLAQFYAGVIIAAVGMASADIGPDAVSAILEKVASTARKLAGEMGAAGKVH